MCEYSTTRDTEYYYRIVDDVATYLSDTAPKTAKDFKGAIENKSKSPFMLVRHMVMKLIQAKNKKINLP